MRKAITLLISYICFTIVLPAQEIQYGLKFKSYDFEKENRTGLNLTPGKPFTFKNGFRMSFDAKFDTDWVHPFGLVFRIITEKQDHIDLILSEIDNTGETMVSFISSSHDVLFKQPFDGHEIDYDKFIHFEIAIDPKSKSIEAFVNNNKYTKESSTLSNFQNVQIVFGKSNLPHFQTTDVPAFTLKNLRITDTKNKPLYQWHLSKHKTDGVYDEINHHFATCENGEWLLDRHVIWQKKTSFQTSANPQFCYNPDGNNIVVVNQNVFYHYDINTNILSRQLTPHQLVYHSSNSNNLLYNPYTKAYNCYTLEMDKGQEVLIYDTVRYDWNKSYETNLPPDYWHHNRLFSPVDQRLYMFFGYGHHRYKNEINRYDPLTQSWEKLSLKGDRIQPRYLAGMGLVDDQHVLVFGGYGSETGNQHLSPQSYYNLFKVNLRTLESKKIWEMENPQTDFAVAGTLIPDETGKFFYALGFNTQQYYTDITLLKFSMDNPEYQIVANPIPFHFEDVKSNVELFLDKASNRFVALVVSPQQDETCDVSIYTLSMPPLTTDSLYQNDANSMFSTYLLYTGIAIVLLLSLAILYFLYKKRKNKPQTNPEDSSVIEKKDKTTTYKHPDKQAIYLFGGFQVFDKNGEDITQEFTPMLRQLFVLLLLNTIKNKKGISSVKLKDILWYDKSDESAKNNRGVFMNKLRQLFDLIGPLYIKNQDIYWSIELGDAVYCDYIKALSLMQTISSGTKPPAKIEEGLNTLLIIVSKGELLPNIQTDWIDSFKSDFSNHLVDLLLEVYKESDVRKSPQMCIHLADTIFIHDSLNEAALTIKCTNLVQMGKYGLAQKAYVAFTKEYKTLFNADFPYSFEQLIKR